MRQNPLSIRLPQRYIRWLQRYGQPLGTQLKEDLAVLRTLTYKDQTYLNDIISEARGHIKNLLLYLTQLNYRFDGMQDAEEFLESLENWDKIRTEEP